MISKQAKDYMNTISSEEVNNYMSNREDIQRLNNLALRLKNELNDRTLTITTPSGSDWDIDRILKTIKEQPMYVVQSKPSLEESMDALCNELKDEDYYRSWKDNIAMAFKDEFNKIRPLGKNISGYSDLVHAVANNAADNFLKLLMK